MPYDDLGHPWNPTTPPRRVVSLVPSLTEALAHPTDGPGSGAGLLVGATDWCTHPADLQVTRVRGTKNPDLRAITALSPDLVVVNKEENRELDVSRMREAGLAVWVTDIETVPQALGSMRRLFVEALGLPVPGWLTEAEELWSAPIPPLVARVAVPIWRDPWMAVGSRTYTGDLLARVGLDNAFGDHPDRYPAIPLEELDRTDLDAVLLPDEPYVFTADDGPEAFTRAPTELVSGRLLTWYGPAMVEAHRTLSALARLLAG